MSDCFLKETERVWIRDVSVRGGGEELEVGRGETVAEYIMNNLF